jgi:exosortase/archaeosortase family protein
VVYAYFTDPRSLVRVAITATTIPIAIIANGLRVAGTGVAAHHIGAEAAQGFFHSFSGWLVFLFAGVMLFATTRALLWMVPSRPQSSGAPAAPLVEAAE